MEQRVGVLRVTIDGSMTKAEAAGQISPAEWIFALEMTKQRLLQQMSSRTPIAVVPRRVDRGEGAD